MENKFTEEDKQMLVDFLNSVAKHAEFKLNTIELIQYFKLLSHMQKIILPKVNANIFEIKRIVDSENKIKQSNEKVE